MLNSDSESVLVKGLRRFASLIRREHGLLPPTPATSSGRCRLNPNGANAHQEAAAHPHGKKAGGLVGQAGGTDEMEVDSDIDEAGTDIEEEDGMEEEGGGEEEERD